MNDRDYHHALATIRSPFPRWTAYLAMLATANRVALDPRNYMLVGSATLAHRGIRDVNDLDIFAASPEALAALEVLGERVTIEGSESDELHYNGATLVRLDVDLPVIGRARVDLFDKLPGVEGLAFTEARERFGWLVHDESSLAYCVGTPRLCLAVKAMALRSERKRANTLQDHTDMLALVGLIARDEGDDESVPVELAPHDAPDWLGPHEPAPPGCTCAKCVTP